jgi:uncharacterized protein
MIVKVRVIPNAKKSEVVGRVGHTLRVKIAAQPVDNKVNDTLQEYLAEFFDVRPRMVQIIRGERAREKTLNIIGRPEDDLEMLMESIP